MGCKKGADAMVRFLFALVALVCVGPQQDSTQQRPITPHEKVKSVTLLTGQSTEVLGRATKALANLAKTGEFSNVSLHCSQEIPERVIAVFSSGFALQANGTKTIQPLVGSIDVENIRFVASVGLKATDSSEVAYLTMVQFHDLSDDDLYRIELKKGLVSGKSAFFVTAREGTRGPAAEFLHNYRDSLISKKAE